MYWLMKTIPASGDGEARAAGHLDVYGGDAYNFDRRRD
jgi:hypothetical protein